MECFVETNIRRCNKIFWCHGQSHVSMRIFKVLKFVEMYLDLQENVFCDCFRSPHIIVLYFDKLLLIMAHNVFSRFIHYRYTIRIVVIINAKNSYYKSKPFVANVHDKISFSVRYVSTFLISRYKCFCTHTVSIKIVV